LQDRASFSINRIDTSVSHSRQLEAALPPSTIASLSSGEFVGLVADDPDQRIALKAFHAEIINDHRALKKEQKNFVELPVVRQVSQAAVQRNYLQVRQDIENIIHAEMGKMMKDLALKPLLVQKNH